MSWIVIDVSYDLIRQRQIESQSDIQANVLNVNKPINS